MSKHDTDDGSGVGPTDRAAVRGNLERFAGPEAVTETDDGTLRADFGSRAHIAVSPDGTVDTGMPLHSFDGTPDRLVFDHDGGELTVELDDGTVYVFRRP